MASLLERYASKIAGVLSCLDRLIITGTIPGICYGARLTNAPMPFLGGCGRVTASAYGILQLWRSPDWR
jgi:hypothetical protein